MGTPAWMGFLNIRTSSHLRQLRHMKMETNAEGCQICWWPVWLMVGKHDYQRHRTVLHHLHSLLPASHVHHTQEWRASEGQRSLHMWAIGVGLCSSLSGLFSVRHTASGAAKSSRAVVKLLSIWGLFFLADCTQVGLKGNRRFCGGGLQNNKGPWTVSICLNLQYLKRTSVGTARPEDGSAAAAVRLFPSHYRGRIERHSSWQK